MVTPSDLVGTLQGMEELLMQSKTLWHLIHAWKHQKFLDLLQGAHSLTLGAGLAAPGLVEVEVGVNAVDQLPQTAQAVYLHRVMLRCFFHPSEIK